MNDLEMLRKTIDECDSEIVEAIEKRFHAAKDVVAYKKDNNLPILQSDRENEVLKKVESYQQSKEYLNEIREIYIYIMNKSKEIQERA